MTASVVLDRDHLAELLRLALDENRRLRGNGDRHGGAVEAAPVCHECKASDSNMHPVHGWCSPTLMTVELRRELTQLVTEIRMRADVRPSVRARAQKIATMCGVVA